MIWRSYLLFLVLYVVEIQINAEKNKRIRVKRSRETTLSVGDSAQMNAGTINSVLSSNNLCAFSSGHNPAFKIRSYETPDLDLLFQSIPIQIQFCNHHFSIFLCLHINDIGW